MNLIDEVARREADRCRREWGDLGPNGIPGIERTVAPIIADVLDILTAEGRIIAATPDVPTCALCGGQRWLIEPGRPLTCMTRDCGITAAAQSPTPPTTDHARSKR